MIETRQPCHTLKVLAWLAYVFHRSNDFFRRPPPFCCGKQNDLPKITGKVAPTIIRKSKRFQRRLICVDYLVLLYKTKRGDPRGTTKNHFQRIMSFVNFLANIFKAYSLIQISCKIIVVKKQKCTCEIAQRKM